MIDPKLIEQWANEAGADWSGVWHMDDGELQTFAGWAAEHGSEQAKAAMLAIKRPVESDFSKFTLYVEALEKYADLAAHGAEEMKQKCWLVCDGIVRFFEDSKDLNPLHRREMETAIAIAKQIKDLK